MTGSVECEGCHCVSTTAKEWRAHLVEDRGEPYVVFYCPPCGEREFGWVPLRELPYR